MYCEKNHNNHNIISFGKMMPIVEKLGNNKVILKETIGKFKRNIEEMINILNKTIENIQHYYNITVDIMNINNENNRKINYEILYNINKIYDNNILEDLNDIINDDNISNKFKKIKDIYDKMTIKHTKSLDIKYKINKNEKIIRIFDSKFVKNNKDKCKIIIKGKEYELTDEFNINNLNKINQNLQLKLKGIKNITNLSYMFKGSESLVLISDISSWDTHNITNMSYLFFGCSSLKFLPDISNWDTSNATNMSYMFCGCSSLISLPDISKWNIDKVTDTSGMFSICSLLTSLPDISNWNTNNISNMNDMFSYCESLLSLPDISKWNISQSCTNENMFNECNKSLVIPPQFSKKSFFAKLFG